MTGRIKDGRFQVAKLTAEELGGRWSDLAGGDAGRAYEAIWTFVAAPEQAPPSVRGRGHGFDGFGRPIYAAERPSGLQVPTDQAPVPPSGNGPASVAGNSHAHHRPVVAWQAANRRAAAEVPKTQGRVVPSRDGDSAVGRNGHRADPALVVGKAHHLRPGRLQAFLDICPRLAGLRVVGAEAQHLRERLPGGDELVLVDLLGQHPLEPVVFTGRCARAIRFRGPGGVEEH